jgi:hypothetical protein
MLVQVNATEPQMNSHPTRSLTPAKKMRTYRLLAFTFAASALCTQVHAIEVAGLIDVRAVAANSDTSWTREGLGKLRYDNSNDGLRIGQAMLWVSGEVTDTITGVAVINASDDRNYALDINEAWLRWNPIPTSAWQTKVKAGLFFPELSLENNGLGWTPTRTISTSAINSWIGEEIRTRGLEFKLTHRGRFDGSPHDYGLTAAAFNGNDPAGTLIAWRGWGIGDRISGVNEGITLADLPAYRSNGPLPLQSREIHVFKEIDNKLGYYVGAHYAYANWFEISGMHYDNRGDPLVVKKGQYAWRTKFNHLSVAMRPDNDWEILLQAMDGSTLMGPNAVNLNYRAWYALVSHPLGQGNLALRYDQFMAKENDILPSDPNGENGKALALAYSQAITPSLSMVAEALIIQSTRPLALPSYQPTRDKARSFTVALRWQF